MQEGAIETNPSSEFNDDRLLNLLEKLEDAYSEGDFDVVSDLVPYLADYTDADIARAKISRRKERLWPPAQPTRD